MATKIGAILLVAAATTFAIVWGGPLDAHDAHTGSHDSLAQSQADSYVGSPTCIRFGGCGYLSHDDRLLTAVDNWGDGRAIIAVGKGCGRTFTVKDKDGKGGNVGRRTVNCDLKVHWLKRISRDGLVTKYSGNSRHPG